jgi:methionyl-tRNA synthetase
VAATTGLDGVLVVLLEACRGIARNLEPFLPDSAARIEQALEHRDAQRGRTLFPKAELVS